MWELKTMLNPTGSTVASDPGVPFQSRARARDRAAWRAGSPRTAPRRWIRGASGDARQALLTGFAHRVSPVIVRKLDVPLDQLDRLGETPPARLLALRVADPVDVGLP